MALVLHIEVSYIIKQKKKNEPELNFLYIYIYIKAVDLSRVQSDGCFFISNHTMV